MPQARILLSKLSLAASCELQQGKGSLLSQIVAKCLPSSPQQQQQCSSTSLQLATAWCAHGSSRRAKHSLSQAEEELLRSAAHYSSSSSSGGASGSHAGSSAGSSQITPSCDVPREHPLHDLYRTRRQHVETAGSNTALYKLPSRISSGTITPEEFLNEEHVLSRFYEEGVHGGLGRRFRRKVPLFQVRWGGLAGQGCVWRSAA